MITALIALVALLIGLLLGFYGRDLMHRVEFMYGLWQEKHDRHEAGVVKPSVARATRTQPQIINLESETGGVMRPKPDSAAIENVRAREKLIKRRHP
jgi:hypothetical protein